MSKENIKFIGKMFAVILVIGVIGALLWTMTFSSFSLSASGVPKSTHTREKINGNTEYEYNCIVDEWQIEQMISEWHDIKSNQFGGDVTKIKTQKDAEKYLQQAFPVLWMEEQEVYEKKVEYLKKKFGLQDLRAA